MYLALEIGRIFLLGNRPVVFAPMNARRLFGLDVGDWLVFLCGLLLTGIVLVVI